MHGEKEWRNITRASLFSVVLTGRKPKILNDLRKGNGAVNEGPAVIKNNGKIFLTYSGNDCGTSDYLIGGLYMNEGEIL